MIFAWREEILVPFQKYQILLCSEINELTSEGAVELVVNKGQPTAGSQTVTLLSLSFF